jgi:hypothetical protein
MGSQIVKKLSPIIIGLVFTAIASHVSALSPGFRLLGAKVTHDEATNQIVVTKANISFQSNGELRTDLLRFQLPDQGSVPYVAILVRNGTLKRGSVEVSLSEGARFYPEVSAVVAKRVLLLSTNVEYTCKNDKLFLNGSPARGKTACLGDGLMVECSGNDVQITATDQSCVASEY